MHLLVKRFPEALVILTVAGFDPTQSWAKLIECLTSPTCPKGLNDGEQYQAAEIDTGDTQLYTNKSSTADRGSSPYNTYQLSLTQGTEWIHYFDRAQKIQMLVTIMQRAPHI